MPPAMPVLFVGHGSPMNALEDNAWTRNWAATARDLPRPTAILCISAHWETRGVAVTAGLAPKTIHDFGAFPQALFDVRYPAPGSPALAERIVELLAPRPVRLAEDWGLDHGTWSVLVKMYPAADIPVVQLSLDRSLTPAAHYELAGRLGPLREEGVLIIGSGDIVHNLRAADFRTAAPVDWALRFRDIANQRIAKGDHQALVHYESLGADAVNSVNSAEHYLPLLYVLGVRRLGEPVETFNDDVFAALSMTSLKIG